MLYIAIVPAGALLAALALWRLRRGTLVLLVATLLLSGAYVTSTILIVTDYEDADGFMDCWPHCSDVQEVVRFAFWFCGGLLVLIAVFGLLGALIAALANRRRRTAE